MKRARVRRQIFVLTPEEKKSVACVLGALSLGLATQHYRATHPPIPSPPAAKELQAAKRVTNAATARARSARGQAAVTAAASRTTQSSLDDDQE